MRHASRLAGSLTRSSPMAKGIPSWRKDHDPEARPLGCRGKYGASGSQWHRAHGEKPCDKCRASESHLRRENRRGQNYPLVLYPCGTWQAAKRHQNKGEVIDLPCKLARNAYEKQLRDKRRAKMAA